MRIGEVSSLAGLSTATLRLYERRSLIPKPSRGANGYREYERSVVDRLAFIKSAQSAGLTLAEIASVVRLREQGEATCSHVQSLLEDRLSDIHAQRQKLARLQGEVEALIARGADLNPDACANPGVCQILESTDAQKVADPNR